MASNNYKIRKKDIEVLRLLGERKVAIANDPVNLERRRLWYKHDACQGERPMVLIESWVAFENSPEAETLCREDWAKDIERALRFEIYRFEKTKDDHVALPYMQCGWRVDRGSYGVESKTTYADRVSGNVSSRHWDPPLKNLDKDLSKLKKRSFSVDREASLVWKAHLEHVFDGIMPVRMRSSYWWTLGMTIVAIDLVGLQEFLTYMCTDPDGVHALMIFLRDDHLALGEWLERENLYTLNNENDYIGSGSMAYTKELPQSDWREGNPVRMKDLWVLCESQETSSISPEMFDEFVFKYQEPLVNRFGLCYYGCCEPVNVKWPVLKKLPNLRRLSISPWCDQQYMAEALGRKYVYSRKPNPTLISTAHFDEDAIRADIRETMNIAHNCELEFIMKDVHTLAGEPQRAARWVELTREVIAEF